MRLPERMKAFERRVGRGWATVCENEAGVAGSFRYQALVDLGLRLRGFVTKMGELASLIVAETRRY